MKEQIKFVLALGAVLLLLPCVLTVFLSGRGAVSFFPGEEDLEGYVAAGTCLALPFSGTEEMRKAQAVLIRSQFCTQTEAERQTRIEEITEQVLKARKQPDFEKMYRLARKAASDTKGEVLYWKGEVCSGAFHPVSAGKTRDGREALQKRRVRLSEECGKSRGCPVSRLSFGKKFYSGRTDEETERPSAGNYSDCGGFAENYSGKDGFCRICPGTPDRGSDSARRNGGRSAGTSFLLFYCAGSGRENPFPLPGSGTWTGNESVRSGADGSCGGGLQGDTGGIFSGNRNSDGWR